MPELKEKQLSNLGIILEAAGEFSSEAEIDFTEPSIDKETVVIESGHQPNFLPHAGLFKKAFLLDLYRKRADDRGRKAIALFGFPDYNLCTTKLLAQNKLPVFNKLGFEKFGFRIAQENIWKRFNYPAKPSRSQWESTLQKIFSHYKKYSISSNAELNDVIETLEDCYTRAKNFPDINAFFISKICSKLTLEVCFFRYSDIQKKGVFIEQWKDIISNLNEYNSIYNDSIESHHLDIPRCAPDFLPFWYHCGCGSKVALSYQQGYATGQCKGCAANHEIRLDKLEEIFRDMSPNAVARNIIFSEGMGTSIFISGTGGGLEYGKISEDISRKLGLNLPVTVSWKSRDYYTGAVHKAALAALARGCGIKKEDILAEDINLKIRDRKNELKQKTADARQRGERAEINKHEGEYKNLCTSVDISKAIFSTTYSFIDIVISHGIANVKECWHHSLKEPQELRVMIKDVAYEADAFNIYKKIEEIED